MVQDPLASALASITGATHVLTDPETRAPYETDWTRRFGGSSRLVVRPGSAEEVAAVIRHCTAAGVAVVTQGGNTGLVGGGVPGPSGPAPVVLATGRLDRIGALDRSASQVTVGAGVTLARLQAFARAGRLVFPVDLAARDSATIGGMVATNAGGLHVIRYGSTRAQVLGLEAVLADGTIISRLGGLVKDNTGYDLSQLMIGSEGTLGVVTAARLRLVPSHDSRVVALLGLDTTTAALEVVDSLRRGLEGLQAAEVFYAGGMDLVCRHSGMSPPLGRAFPVYLVVECAGGGDPSELFFEALGGIDLADDASAVAADAAGIERLWAYRERHSEAVSSLGIPHKLDVTLPLGRLADFEQAVRPLVARAAPGATTVIWGHLGDGNLHVNVVGPPPDDESVDGEVLTLVASMGGSISAEHGIGRAKARWLHLSRSAAELAVMRTVKDALDPAGTLNPGVLLGEDRSPSS